MKFLALPTLASVAEAIDGIDNGETTLSCKLDCYSCTATDVFPAFDAKPIFFQY
jgi:hypothetical protein